MMGFLPYYSLITVSNKSNCYNVICSWWFWLESIDPQLMVSTYLMFAEKIELGFLHMFLKNMHHVFHMVKIIWIVWQVSFGKHRVRSWLCTQSRLHVSDLHTQKSVRPKVLLIGYGLLSQSQKWQTPWIASPSTPWLFNKLQKTETGI